MYVKERFKLNNRAKDHLKSLVPKFGYNGYGEFVYKRTYSRVMDETTGQMESWFDTVLRVIEGTFSIRKDWYLKNYIVWAEDYWQNFAEKFGLSLFNMKWFPAGRGLWMMGTDFVYDEGAMSLANCGYVRIDSATIIEDFQWMMDALMLGVGIGFHPVRDELKVYIPRGSEDYIVPDTREGWWTGWGKIIRSYIQPGMRKIRPIFDKIRAKGTPIKRFGGTCSGPEPLQKLYERTVEFFEQYQESSYYDIVRLKADLGNACGVCVVAGNVRRSAEMMKGSIYDTTFLNLKNYHIYPERADWGWMSNNSVELLETEDFKYLGEIAKRVINNGEPGINNRINMKKGRLGHDDNLKEDKAEGFNPCLTYDSEVLTADGRGYVKIGELVGTDLNVFCINDHNEIVIRKMRNPRKTGEKQKIVKIIFDDGSSLRCTVNHKIMLRSNEYVRADNLKYGDSVALVNRYNSKNPGTDSYWDNYVRLGYRGLESKFEHRLIAEEKYGFIGDDHVHHLNGNKKDNNPENLILKDKISHLMDHSQGESNPRFSGVDNEQILELGITFAKKLGRRFSQNEWIGPDLNSDYRRKYFRSFLEFSMLCADLAEVTNDPIDLRTLRHFQDMISQGYEAEIVDSNVKVLRICENCKKDFWIDSQRREQSFCSLDCHQAKRDYRLNVAGQKKHFDAKRETIREQQLDIFTKLKLELGREPTKEEWTKTCKDEQISASIGRPGSVFTSWNLLIWAAKGHNHRVISVMEDGEEDVYNGTVDEFHNFITKICDDNTKLFNVSRGIVNLNCGEQPLENKELCIVPETHPTICDGEEDWIEACTYATFYGCTVQLLPTHHSETNRIIARNRRIGVSIADYTGWKHDEGVHNITRMLRRGYLHIRGVARHLAEESGTPEPIRVTTIKPGGTGPKLPGITSGIGHPTFRHTLRRTNVGENTPMYPFLLAKGFKIEKSVYSEGTSILEYPIIQGPAKPATEVSLWEQAMNLILFQREWSDNAVSNTLYFKPKWILLKHFYTWDDFEDYVLDELSFENIDSHAKLQNALNNSEDPKIIIENYKFKINDLKIYKYNPNHEEDDIEAVLSMTVPHIKSLSLLPHEATGVYKQIPEEGISEEEYNRRVAELPKVDWNELKGNEALGEKYCEGPQCQISGYSST